MALSTYLYPKLTPAVDFFLCFNSLGFFQRGKEVFELDTPSSYCTFPLLLLTSTQHANLTLNVDFLNGGLTHSLLKHGFILDYQNL